jgi:LacI family transcriptional regulator
MSELKILSIPEQIAAHLRGELARGRWSDRIPGRGELTRQLGVGITSLEEALRQLEREGLIVSQGAGRTRRIADAARNPEKRRLRIAMLAYERSNLGEGISSEVVHVLREAGHDAFFARTSLLDLGFNVRRIAGFVKQNEADAWIISGATREITEWFSAQAKPAFSLFGRRRGVPIASVGPDKAPAYAAAARRLIALGHRRIVLLVRPDRRLPVPGTPERAFLAGLAAHGIEPGPYHLPDWKDGIDGFQGRLERLFEVTPPTALLVDELMLFVAAQQFLARKRLRVPDEVSLVSLDGDPAFDWCRPSVAHVHWDREPVLRRVVGWANHIARGKRDRRETNTHAEFIDGGTIGPVKR